eukprot:TRINITY_DN21506_c0_g1_i1.p1 TRINITY_DN21506_c0_g1~~TRINITY_DN21506_c0_g1_i1.p1  ORF type:complete len:432 (+),score=115.70 TRINITY_DN21506_c0_g1_i1:84-1298(+)
MTVDPLTLSGLLGNMVFESSQSPKPARRTSHHLHQPAGGQENTRRRSRLDGALLVSMVQQSQGVAMHPGLLVSDQQTRQARDGMENTLSWEKLQQLPSDDDDEATDMQAISENIAHWMENITLTLVTADDIAAKASTGEPLHDAVDRANLSICERVQQLSEMSEDPLVDRISALRESGASGRSGEVMRSSSSSEEDTSFRFDDATVEAALRNVTDGIRFDMFMVHTGTSRGDHEMDRKCGTLDVLDTHNEHAPWDLGHRLFLGNGAAGRDGALLKSRGVTHVVRLSEEADPGQTSSLAEHGIHLTHIKAPDRTGYPILSQHLMDCRHVWQAARERRGALCVHCHAGLNRSVAVCVGLLLTGVGERLVPTITSVATIRKNQVLINHSFRRQLVDLAVALNLLLPF